MDELGGFEPTDTTGFVKIESIRIKKYVKTFLSSIDVDTLFPIDGHRRTYAEDRVASSRRMYMVVAFEYPIYQVRDRRKCLRVPKTMSRWC